MAFFIGCVCKTYIFFLHYSTNIEHESTTSNQTSHSVDPTTINTSVLTRHLRQRLSVLRSLREGFIEQTGAEPSVSLRYFDQSTSSSTISLSADNLNINDPQIYGAAEQKEMVMIIFRIYPFESCVIRKESIFFLFIIIFRVTQSSITMKTMIVVMMKVTMNRI